MKPPQIGTLLALTASVIVLASCASVKPGFHNDDNTALVVQSFNDQTCQMLQPKTTAKESIDEVLAEAAKLDPHQTAVVILEDYYDEEIGDQFRDRGTPWVVGLRRLGYPHIVFLKGLGVPNPENLPIVVQYY
jgi:hypothetical protein